VNRSEKKRECEKEEEIFSNDVIVEGELVTNVGVDIIRKNIAATKRETPARALIAQIAQ